MLTHNEKIQGLDEIKELRNQTDMQIDILFRIANELSYLSSLSSPEFIQELTTIQQQFAIFDIWFQEISAMAKVCKGNREKLIDYLQGKDEEMAIQLTTIQGLSQTANTHLTQEITYLNDLARYVINQDIQEQIQLLTKIHAEIQLLTESHAKRTLNYQLLHGKIIELTINLEKIKLEQQEQAIWADLKPGGKIARKLQEEFLPAKNLQHQIYAWQQQFKNFDYYLKQNQTPELAPAIIPEKKFLATRTDYRDLIFLTELFAPAKVCEVLANKLQTITVFAKFALSRLPYLKNRLGKHLAETIRLQRAIDSYNEWHSKLIEKTPEEPTTIEIEQIFSSIYITFFKQEINSQTISNMIIKINQTLETTLRNEQNPEKTYQYFLTTKARIKQAIQEKKQNLKNSETTIGWLLANTIQLVTQQIEYQFGVHITAALLNQNRKLKLTRQRKQQLQQMAGIVCLLGGLCLSGYYGYFYRFIHVISRRIMIQLYVLINLGEKLDNRLIRLDEQGIIEKFHLIETSVGLLIHLTTIFCTQQVETNFYQELTAFLQAPTINPLFIFDVGRYQLLLNSFYQMITKNIRERITVLPPAAIAYTAATAISRTLSKYTKSFLHYFTDFSDVTINLIRLITQAVPYPFIYRAGFQAGQQILPATTKEAESQATTSRQEALNTFGIYANTPRKQIRTRYYELSEWCHPDKGRTQIMERCPGHIKKFEDVTGAKEVLLPKLK